MTFSYRDDLVSQLLDTRNAIDNQIQQLEEDGKKSDFWEDLKPHEIRDANGNYLITPLLLAKSQVLFALVELEKLND